MLTADTGPSMRALVDEQRPTPSWDEIVALYAGLQLELTEAVDELLALGVPDSRPGRSAIPSAARCR